MKAITCSLIIFLYYCPSYAQDFIIHEDRLIYEEPIMKQLRHIVDSLNQQFERGEFKQFYSLEQAQGHFVEFSGRFLQKNKLIKDLKSGMS